MKHYTSVVEPPRNTRRTTLLAVVAVALIGIAALCFLLYKVHTPKATGGTFASDVQTRVLKKLDELSEAPEPAERPTQNDDQPEANTSQPPTEPQVNEALQAQLAQAAESSGMLTCASVIDLTNGSVASFQGDTQIPSASMIKLLIAYTFLEQVKAQNQSLDAFYTLQPQDLVGGTGTLIGLGAGASITYRDALMRMIDVSDNVGANILIDAVGFDAINASATKLGLAQTSLNRRMMDENAIANGIENYTSANDLATLLKMVYDGTFVDADSSALMRQALEQQQDWGGIRSGLPEGTVFAHKTGSLASVRHDGGIVEGEHPYVLVVLCGGQGFYEDGALQAMANIAQVVNTALTAA